MALRRISRARRPRCAGTRRARPASDAATLPPGFQETVAFSGLTNPTAVRFCARRPRLRRREERRDQGLRQPRRHDADGLRRPAHERPQLLGPRPARAGARPELPGQPVRLRPLRARRRDRRRRAALGHARRALRRLPDPAGRDRGRLRRQRPALAPPGGRQRDDRPRAGADRGLVPAVSRATRSAASPSAPTARSTSAAATARASTSPTGARTAARSTRAATRPAASARR